MGLIYLENIDIVPTQTAIPESGLETPEFTIDNAIYNTDSFYPGELAHINDPVILRDIRMVQVAMYPVQYNPVTRQLKIYRDLTVSVSYTNDNVINPKTITEIR